MYFIFFQYNLLSSAKKDNNSELKIKTLKGIVTGCRSLRAEMNLSPAVKVPLMIYGQSAMSFEIWVPHLKQLAKLSEVNLYQNEDLDTKSPTAIVGTSKLMLDVDVDVDAEKARMKKEINKMEMEITKLTKNLANDSFLQKAPVDVVNKVKDQLESYSIKLKKSTTYMKRPLI